MRRLLKDTAIYGAGDLLFRFVSFAVFPIYANVFSVEQYGVMALISTTAGLISILLSLGMNNAIQRYYWDPDMPEEQRPVLVTTGFAILVLWSFLVTALLLFSLYPFRDTFDQRYDIEWLFLALALAANLPSLIVSYCLDVLRLHFSPWWFSALAALRSLSAVALSLILVVALKQGLLGVFVGQALAFTLAMPLGLWLIRKELMWRFDLRLAREIVLFGYPFIFVGLAYWVFTSMDRWMLGELSDITNVGLYSIAYSFASILTFVTAAFAQAWSPFAIKLYAEDPDYRDKIGRLFSYWFFALALIGLVISLFAYEVLRVTTPESYWSAATTLSVLAMGLVLLGTTQFTALGISLEKKSNLLSVAAWIAAIVNFLLNLVLIPIWGALGSGAATFAAYAILTGLYLYWAQKLHSLPLETKKLLFSLLIVVSTPFLSALLYSFKWDVWITGIKVLILGLVLLFGFAVRIVKLSDIKRLSLRGIP